jgi:hypothetical protein
MSNKEQNGFFAKPVLYVTFFLLTEKYFLKLFGYSK